MSALKLLSTSSLILAMASAWGQTPRAQWPVLKVAAHTFPPFQYKKNGEMVGPMVKIMGMVCERAQVRCDVTMDAFAVQLPKAQAGEFDVIYSFLLEADEERGKQFLLSPSIVNTVYSFFTVSTSRWTWTGDPKDLDGRTVGVYGPSGTQIVAQRTVSKNPTASLVVEKSNLVAFQQLIVGKYGEKAAIVVNRDVGLALMKQNNIFGPRLAGDVEPPVTFGFGFSRKSDKAYLAPRLFDALNELKTQGLVRRALMENPEHPLVPSP